MNLKRLTALVLAVMMAVSLASCGKKKEEEETAGTAETESQAEEIVEETHKVGLSLPNAQTGRGKIAADYLVQRFTEAGFELTFKDAGSDAAKQVADVQAMIREPVDLLVVSSLGDERMAAAAEEAENAGIIWISYDSLLMDAKGVDYLVAEDDYEAGHLQAQYLVSELGLKAGDNKNEYTVEFMAGDAEDFRAGLFFNGAYDVLTPFFDAGNLSVPSGQQNFTVASAVEPEPAQAVESGAETAGTAEPVSPALTRMKTILDEDYKEDELNAILCGDDASALDAAAAVKDSYKGKNEVVICGRGDSEASLAAIMDGKQAVTVISPVEGEAFVTAELVIALMHGTVPDADLIKEDWEYSCRFDTSNYDNGTALIPTYLIAPDTVDKDSITKKLVDTGWYTMEGDYPKLPQ